MKRLKVCRPALAASTAFLMISSIVSMAASASGTNEIKLSSDKISANVGDTINVTASIAPDKAGVAGFTLDLHFDPKDVSVYIPTEDELSSKYDLSGSFTVITNYSASDSYVKIVGANLKGQNVKSESDIALATFTVKDTTDGKADFWVEVETLITESGEDYVSANYSAPTQQKPVAVSVADAGKAQEEEKTSLKEEVDKLREEAGLTDEEEGEKKNYVVSSPDAETFSKQQGDKINYVVSTPDSTASNDTTQAVTDDTQAVPETDKTQPVSETQPVQNEQQETVVQQPVNMNETADALFKYVAGASGFASEQTVQYNFRLSEANIDYSQLYNINVNVKTTGQVGGAVGALKNGEWVSEIARTYEAGETVWSYDNVDPNTTSDQVFVQLYTMSPNTSFEIESIDIINVNTYETAAHITTGGESEGLTGLSGDQLIEAGIVGETEVVANQPATIAVNVGEATPSAVENKGSEAVLNEDNETAGNTADTAEEQKTVPVSNDNAAENTADNNTTGNNTADNAVQPTVDDTKTSAQPSVITNSQSAVETEAKVAEMETSAAEKPVAANKTNPNTGLSIAFRILTVAALGEILFSLFIIFYNRYLYKDDEE